MNYFPLRIALIALAMHLSIITMDNPHFYRATNVFPEPRIEHDYLGSFTVTLGKGSTTKSLNGCRQTVPLFDIYGINSFPINNTPVNFSIDGTFKIIESNVHLIQNLAKGFLFYFHLPLRNLHIKDLTFINHSDFSDSSFLLDLGTILAQNSLDANPTNETGIGDFTALIGWTHNYQNTQHLDYIDVTCMLGILNPTGKKRNEHELFSLPLGYNGHWGFPINAMLSIGCYEWITLGAHVSMLFFAPRTQCTRVYASADYSGILQTNLIDAAIKKGMVWDTGTYFKADHFAYGLSFTAAYSYAGEQKTILRPSNDDDHSLTITDTTEALKKWNMHTLQLYAEYDFAKQDSKVGTRIGIFYNYQLGGTRVFKTNMGGGAFGLDVAWDL